jgi:hypothetical protein
VDGGRRGALKGVEQPKLRALIVEHKGLVSAVGDVGIIEVAEESVTGSLEGVFRAGGGEEGLEITWEKSCEYGLYVEIFVERVCA